MTEIAGRGRNDKDERRDAGDSVPHGAGRNTRRLGGSVPYEE
jgi:hypothetical protein